MLPANWKGPRGYVEMAFNQNVSFTMGKAVQHDTIFMTLLCHSSYLDHLKSAVKEFSAVRNALFQSGALFPDDVLRRCTKDEIAKHEASHTFQPRLGCWEVWW